MKRALLFLIASFSFGIAKAQTPTWAQDIAPIFYANCTSCHNTSGIAPFSLLTYNDAVAEASSIDQAVGVGHMPPWPPDVNYSRFAHERKLTPTEIQKITDWVNNGTPSGNLSQAPTPPTYSTAPQITNPDLVAQIPTYTHSSSTDDYRCFVIPTTVGTNQYVTGIEVIPGNRSIVHHVLIYQDQANTCVTLDNNDPGPGYTSFGGVGSNTADLVGAWVPGQGVYTLPPNMGISIGQNTKLILQIHYPGVSAPAIDSTKVLLKLSSGPMRTVALDPILNYYSTMTNGPLVIPANQVKSFHEQANCSINATVISVAPHMHLVGTSIKSWAVTPANDTIPFINIPEWDFHWQGFYNFAQLVHVPQGSMLHAEAVYDNTINNPENPNTPPQQVTAGEATTDEMMLVYFAYTYYQPGDENIIIDSTAVVGIPAIYKDLVSTPQLYAPYPVPSADEVNVSFLLPNAANVKLEVLDALGRTVLTSISEKEMQAGIYIQKLSLGALPSGSYIISLEADGIKRSKTIVK
jgi:hypothetical protein